MIALAQIFAGVFLLFAWAWLVAGAWMRFVYGPKWRRYRRRPELRVKRDPEFGRYVEEYQPEDGWEKRW